MIYFDTNVLIYAFCKNVDDLAQKELSQEVLKDSILKERLLLSEIVLYEFAFISNKLGETKQTIQSNLEFLSKYVKSADVRDEVLNVMNITSNYKYSFDVYHMFVLVIILRVVNL